jgi:hypothetical protein
MKEWGVYCCWELFLHLAYVFLHMCPMMLFVVFSFLLSLVVLRMMGGFLDLYHFNE